MKEHREPVDRAESVRPSDRYRRRCTASVHEVDDRDPGRELGPGKEREATGGPVEAQRRGLYHDVGVRERVAQERVVSLHGHDLQRCRRRRGRCSKSRREQTRAFHRSIDDHDAVASFTERVDGRRRCTAGADDDTDASGGEPNSVERRVNSIDIGILGDKSTAWAAVPGIRRAEHVDPLRTPVRRFGGTRFVRHRDVRAARTSSAPRNRASEARRRHSPRLVAIRDPDRIETRVLKHWRDTVGDRIAEEIDRFHDPGH